MLEITVCIGSSCHLKGSYGVIRALEELIARHGLEEQVELRAGFCLGWCTEGVAMQVGERPVLNAREESMEEIFNQYVLPEVKDPGRTQN